MSRSSKNSHPQRELIDSFMSRTPEFTAGDWEYFYERLLFWPNLIDDLRKTRAMLQEWGPIARKANGGRRQVPRRGAAQ
jgi:hypothetical protein